MQKYFCQPVKHTIFQQGRKGYKAKGHKVIKAGGQKFLKLIFLAFYASVSPLHPLLRHNTPNITEPMEIAKCAKLALCKYQAWNWAIFTVDLT